MAPFNRDHKSGSKGGSFGKRNFGGGGRGFGDGSDRPQMHQAICSECGQECEVPFRPTGDRPVFCSNCFKKQGGGAGPSRSGGGFNRGKPSFGDRKMFEAICAKCGNKCEVPFRPTEGKPVYCSQCFDKGGNAGGNKGPDQNKAQFDMLNAKLDRILKALNLNETKSAPEVKPAKEEKKVPAKTKAAPKKAKAKKKK